VSFASWLVFLAAAAVGAMGRYLLDGFVQDRTAGAFPWGTFAVNVTGCLVLGALTGLGLHHGLDATARTVVGTGGVGAYTTFSTFTFETIRLAEDGANGAAVTNVAGSLFAGLAAAGLGLALASL
jgi:CrcB protein